nr:hypothetical protein Iba_chr12dCG0480 [Ipomoea batatas]GMD71871.1 hypothetical protein Iba_chr12fCG3070 [Ipomoea batatas]
MQGLETATYRLQVRVLAIPTKQTTLSLVRKMKYVTEPPQSISQVQDLNIERLKEKQYDYSFHPSMKGKTISTAMAAATRDEWSDARSRLAGIEGEFKRNEASGSFNSDGCDGWENSIVCFFEGGSACLHGQTKNLSEMEKNLYLFSIREGGGTSLGAAGDCEAAAFTSFCSFCSLNGSCSSASSSSSEDA